MYLYVPMSSFLLLKQSQYKNIQVPKRNMILTKIIYCRNGHCSFINIIFLLNIKGAPDNKRLLRHDLEVVIHDSLKLFQQSPGTGIYKIWSFVLILVFLEISFRFQHNY